MCKHESVWFLRQNLVDRVRKILTALILAEHIDGFIADAPPGWRVHRLSGDRQDEWSVSVSGNWRITFKEEDSYIDRLNLAQNQSSRHGPPSVTG